VEPAILTAKSVTEACLPIEEPCSVEDIKCAMVRSKPVGLFDAQGKDFRAPENQSERPYAAARCSCGKKMVVNCGIWVFPDEYAGVSRSGVWADSWFV